MRWAGVFSVMCSSIEASLTPYFTMFPRAKKSKHGMFSFNLGLQKMTAKVWIWYKFENWINWVFLCLNYYLMLLIMSLGRYGTSFTDKRVLFFRDPKTGLASIVFCLFICFVFPALLVTGENIKFRKKDGNWATKKTTAEV